MQRREFLKRAAKAVVAIVAAPLAVAKVASPDLGGYLVPAEFVDSLHAAFTQHSVRWTVKVAWQAGPFYAEDYKGKSPFVTLTQG